MKKFFESFSNLKGEGTIWGIALRKRSNVPLYKDGLSEFTFIKNSFRYWKADPFLFDYNGQTFLFAEMFDRIKGKGVVGVAKIKNGKCGRFKVCLDLDYHLSYPCVFVMNDEILMVPECAKSGKITAYKCTDFPYSWEKAFDICNEVGVDTTPLQRETDTNTFFVSTIRTKSNKENNCLFAIDLSGTKKALIENDPTTRPAGHFIVDGDTVLRPSQDCSNSYGGALVFKNVVNSSIDDYQEETEFTIHASDINLSSMPFDFNGIHTYNISQEYEVIDLSYNVGKSLQYIIKKMIRHFYLK